MCEIALSFCLQHEMHQHRQQSQRILRGVMASLVVIVPWHSNSTSWILVCLIAALRHCSLEDWGSCRGSTSDSFSEMKIFAPLAPYGHHVDMLGIDSKVTLWVGCRPCLVLWPISGRQSILDSSNDHLHLVLGIHLVQVQNYLPLGFLPWLAVSTSCP